LGSRTRLALRRFFFGFAGVATEGVAAEAVTSAESLARLAAWRAAWK